MCTEIRVLWSDDSQRYSVYVRICFSRLLHYKCIIKRILLNIKYKTYTYIDIETPYDVCCVCLCMYARACVCVCVTMRSDAK